MTTKEPIEQKETFNCGDCGQTFLGEKLRIAKVGERGVRLVCPKCSEKYSEFIVRITKLYYWCPVCGDQHYFDLSRTILLDTFNFEHWNVMGVGDDGCSTINVNLKGIIEVTTKSK